MKLKPSIIFDVITLFPDVVTPYISGSIIGRAVKSGLIKANVINLRDFTPGPYHKADDRPYGGGPGMVMKAEPIIEAIQFAKSKAKNKKAKVILFSPAGKQFDDKTSIKFAKDGGHIILVCGHYEGIDERVKKIIKSLDLETSELSIGPYVLTGGELPALTVVDAISRKVKGVLGKEDSLEEKRYGVGVPVYTRPETLIYKKKSYKVPKVLMSGNHKDIEKWRLGNKAD